MYRRREKLTVEGLRAYEREVARRNLGRVRMAALLGFVLVPTFWLLDLLAFEEHLGFFLGLRLAVAVLLGLTYWIATRWRPDRWIGVLGVFVGVIVGLMLNIMIRMTGGYTSSYYAGLSLLFLVATVIVRFNVRQAAVACGVSYLVYLLGIALFDKVEDFGALANNNFFLFASLLVALVGAYMTETLERKEFLSRFSLLQANRRLREVDQLKSQFFASVSHELRTPLTLLLAPAESLLAEETGPIPAQARRFVELIHANALRLLKQINDLLDLVRLDARRMELSASPIDLGQLVTAVVRAAEPLARQRGIELAVSVQRSVDAVNVDGEKVEKVVLNLVSNALKFTPPGGRVDLSLMQAASGARITVSDTGIGIAHKDLERIFDRFAQVDGSATRRYPGSGIGLALVKELVELHGGWVEVESQPGVGSTFSVTIPGMSADRRAADAPRPGTGESARLGLVDLAAWAPAADRTAEPGAAAGAREPEVAAAGAAAAPEALGSAVRLARQRPGQTRGRGRGPRVTVVVMEDNGDLREFLVALLGQHYRVVTSADGEEGLAVVRSVRPELVVADVMMPRKSGLDVCRELKADKDEALASTPVLLLTAKAELGQRLEGYEQGADDYLVKPFNSKELLARVRVLLRLRALEQALARRNVELAGELSATRDQLVQSEKLNAVGQLAAGVAHEINNPLTSVISFAQLLLKGRVSEADARRCLELIASEGERAAQIVRGLLAFARKHTPERSLQNLRQVLDSVLELREYAFHKAGIVVERQYADLPPVMVDPHQMQQVFLNVLVNAEQALAERRGGRVVVRLERGALAARVTIADDGPGIAPEDLPRIFEPFFSTKDVGQGTGLGLSICYGIVQEHGGRIWAESEPGRGATFVIELPLERGDGGR